MTEAERWRQVLARAPDRGGHRVKNVLFQAAPQPPVSVGINGWMFPMSDGSSLIVRPDGGCHVTVPLSRGIGHPGVTRAR